jgi:hypothetical protein
MKTLFTILLIVIYSVAAHAQSSMLDSPQADVRAKMAKTANTFLFKESKTPDGAPYLCYSVGNDVYVTYYFKNDHCNLYSVVYPINKLTDIVQEMNKECIRVNDSTWCSKNLQYHMTINYDKPSKLLFWLNFTSL